MLLQSIKLAGFKSFVDPTTVTLKSNLVAVVGPNGSGKSNIIDAVRWVMGESSAKFLRGELMSDVIFNGSSSRKPAGFASVELIFDNQEGKFGGQYASYNKISVKREVTLDGQSDYFLNGSRCRRKDIKEVFLGTGLGARSYAIIMQDTISSLIEAKPEDLRIYIEEVAGISKYKERRRETELRIKHTRENLERLTDLRDEITKQLERLDQQAKAAERYKILKQDERLTKAELHGLQWKILNGQTQKQQQAVLELETQLEAEIATIRHIDAEFTELYEGQIVATDEVNEAQSNYYQTGSEINRLEQTILHQQERQQQLQRDQQQAKLNLNKAEQQTAVDRETLSKLIEEEQLIKPELEQSKNSTVVAAKELGIIEEKLQQWQQRWDEFNDASVIIQRQAEVERLRIQHLEQRHTDLTQKIEKLQREQESQGIADTDQQFLPLQNELQEKVQVQEQLQQQQTKLQDAFNNKRQFLQERNQQLDKEKNKLQQLCGKQTSLEALQQAALGQNKNAFRNWLKQNNLATQPCLAETIKVTAGWEKAVETVLATYLEAVCIDSLGTIKEKIKDLHQGNVAFIDTNYPIELKPVNNSLIEKVTANSAISALLANIAVANDLETALAILPLLQSHQSVITVDGLWLGHGWLRVAYGEDAQNGIITRQNELNLIKEQVGFTRELVASLSQKQQMEMQQLQDLELQKEQLQISLRDSSKNIATLEMQLRVKQTEFTHQQKRAAELVQMLTAAQEQYQLTQKELQQAVDIWQNAHNQVQKDMLVRTQLSTERDNIRQQIEIQRKKAREYQDNSHKLALRYESIAALTNSLKQNIARNESNLKFLLERLEQSSESLKNSDQPILELQQQLELVLTKQVTAEKVLLESKKKLADFDYNLRQLTQKRHEVEVTLEKVRSTLEQKRMSLENIKVRTLTHEEQVQALEFDLQQLLQELPAEANEIAWQEKLEALEKRISRLGAINLAAIDEFKEVSLRKGYLDAQNTDLETALNTLETAIRKIDKETRQRFKETYDTVNQHFQVLFPKIFGGGSASLELVGEDLLDTGVTVMARPPGKRNSTIHLLSGGEKALTALSLVFSLFRINPAPFCMLDEVDAPLDDANIARFCNLVKEMAKEVQFIFISHNKVAIEMAKQLIGVTMREPGVSRLVAVDVEEAVALAEA